MSTLGLLSEMFVQQHNTQCEILGKKPGCVLVPTASYKPKTLTTWWSWLLFYFIFLEWTAYGNMGNIVRVRSGRKIESPDL